MSTDEHDLSELERALAGLQPAAAPFDRDRLMFQAGRTAAERPRRWLWPATAGLTTSVAACLGLVLLLQPAPVPVVQIVYVDRPVPPTTPDKPAPPTPPAPAPSTGVLAASSYWLQQQALERRGFDVSAEPIGAAGAIAPGPGPASGAAVSVWDWRSSLFNAGVD